MGWVFLLRTPTRSTRGGSDGDELRLPLCGDGSGDAGRGLLARFPGPGHHLRDAMSGMVGQSGEDIGEPGARVDVVEFAGLDQRIDGCGALAPRVRRDAMMPGFWAARLSSPIHFIRSSEGAPSSPLIRSMAAFVI